MVVEGVQEQHLCLHPGPARVEAGAGVPEVKLQVQQILRPFLDFVTLAAKYIYNEDYMLHMRISLKSKILPTFATIHQSKLPLHMFIF